MKPIEHAHALRRVAWLDGHDLDTCEAAAKVIVELANENERLQADATDRIKAARSLTQALRHADLQIAELKCGKSY